jgi:hypothetical protein
MVISRKQSDSMLKAAKPLIKWLNKNGHPHCKIIVTTDSAELKEGVAIVKTEEFIKD